MNEAQTTETIVTHGKEMEEKRKIMFRAFELTAGQIEHDATELSIRAVMHPDVETVKREHMIHTAFMLRETAAWIRKALLPEEAAPTGDK